MDTRGRSAHQYVRDYEFRTLACQAWQKVAATSAVGKPPYVGQFVKPNWVLRKAQPKLCGLRNVSKIDF